MKGLPWDYTFCCGSRCPRPGECLRWTRHPANDVIPTDRPISVASFADHDGKCDKFIAERTQDVTEGEK